MNEASEFRDLLPALPEIVLAVGAMVLLMLGAFRGERSASAMNWLAILLLIGAGAIVVWLPAGKLVAFGIYPKPVLDMSAAAVSQLVDNYQRALGAAKTAALLVQ